MREEDDELAGYFQELALGEESPAYMIDPEPPASLVGRWNGHAKQGPETTSTEPEHHS